MKNRISHIIIFLFILPVILFIPSCGKKKVLLQVSVNFRAPQPLKPGTEKDFESIRVTFDQSAAELEVIGKEVTDKVKLTPEHPGKWMMESDKGLRFIPGKDWPLGEKYTVVMDKSLFSTDVRLNKYNFSFTTPSLTASIPSIEYYISPLDPAEKRVVANVRFNYPLDPLSFEARVKLKVTNSDPIDTWYSNKVLKHQVSYNDLYTEAYIKSEILKIPSENVKINLTIAKGSRSSLGGSPTGKKLEGNATVQGISNFVKIRGMNLQHVKTDDYKLDQVFIIETKGKARAEDMAENLDIYILPRDKPAQPGIPAATNYRWNNTKIIDNKILNSSRKLPFEVQQTELEYSSLTSFSLKAAEYKYLFIRLKSGIPFYGGYELPVTHEKIIRVPAVPKEISIMHEGSILSMTGDKKISLMAYNIDKVDFEAGRLIDDQINHLVSQSNGNINNIRFKSRNFNENNLVEKKYSSRSLVINDPGEPQYFSFDFSGLVASKGTPYGKNGIFFLKVTGRDIQGNTTVSDSRLVIITDLGILVKQNTDATRDLFVQSIATGSPVGGAKVEVIGRNGQPLITKTTDGSGHAVIPGLNSSNEKYPVAYLVTRGNDLSFLPYQGNGRWLDYSGFDTGGVHGKSDPAALSAYLFSDRGIYRPGDTINIGMIVKSTDWERSPVGIPLEVSIDDSRGLEVHNERLRLSPEGLEEISYKTEYTSPTGNYHVNLYHIKTSINRREYKEFLGSVAVKVEEFLPDRMRLTTSFSILPSKGWIKPENLKAIATLANLFGTPATGNRVNAQYTLSPAYFYFSKYRDYKFHDPYNKGKTHTEYLGSGNTDEEGICEFDINMDHFADSTYRIAFLAEAFEKGGGRGVSSENYITVSPLDYIIGSKSGNDLNYIYKDTEAFIDFISLNPDVEPVQASNLIFVLNEVKWVSVLTKMNNGTYKYQSVKKRILLKESTSAIPANGLKYALPTRAAGEFELLVLTPGRIEMNRNTFSVISRENLTRRLDKNAELKIKLSKNDYQAGEEIEIFIQAPYTGSGLITIERDKVYTYKWFTTWSSSFTERIKIPVGLEGNAYVNVAYIRSIDSGEIFMSPLSYGVANFSLSKDKRTTKVKVDIPDEARPGLPFPIKYSTDKKSKIIVFAVDEGILQVAKYKTPDPLSHFFKKQALEVRTSQILDLILPEFSVVQSLAAMGGGGDVEAIAKNLNPFKRKSKPPVVFWSGIIDADKTLREISYKVPDHFNGTLHVFAVAVNNGSIGVADETSHIHDYFVITPNVPLFAAPGDNFTVTLTVANTLKGSGDKAEIEFNAEASSHLAGKNQSVRLKIPEGKDAVMSLDFEVKDILGAADIRFTAASGEYVSTISESLSIRPPIPYFTTLTTGYLKKDSGQLPVERKLYPHYRTKELSLSFVPLGISKGLLKYLDSYPYGCSEQLTSRAFPYVALSGISEFGVNYKMAEGRVREMIRILRSRQTGNGAFGIWTANEYTNPFVNTYILHFLTEAAEAGFYVPEYVLNQGIKYLKNYLNEKKTSYFEMEARAYGIYVLTRNEIVTTPFIEKLITLYKKENPGWEKQLSGLYIAASLKLLQDNSGAEKIIRKFEVAQKKLEKKYPFHNRHIQNAQFLYILSRHFKSHLKRVSRDLVEAVTSSVESGSYNTINSSYAILGLSEYIKTTDVLQSGKVTVSEINSEKKQSGLNIPDNLFPVIPFSDNAVKLLLKNGEKLGLYYQVIEAGFDTVLPEKKMAGGLEVYKEFKNTKGKVVTSAELGEELEVHITIRSKQSQSYGNMVIVDLVPGGFEPVLDTKPGGTLNTEYFDRREDRMIVYCSIDKNARTFIYRIKAVNKGSFKVPPVFAENMYDRAVQAMTPFASSMIIKEASGK